MHRLFATTARRFGVLASFASLGVAAALAWVTVQWNASVAKGDDGSSNVVAIEEDWELVVGEPEPDTLAPQVTSVISPIGNADLVYAAVDFNHHSQFEFSNGGIQLQVWTNDQPVITAESHANARLNQHNETITWTQRMSVADGGLTFNVLNGQSETWGNFGGDAELSITMGTSLENLNAYNPDVSVQNSGVGFASNRVKSLVLKKVRAINAAGDVTEDSTERSVFTRDSQ